MLLFQSQNLDQIGQPHVVDGKVGELTWWSLHHPKPIIQTPSAVDFLQMPAASMGGSKHGCAALAVAIDELTAGTGEIGGNNRRPFVKKHMHGIVPEGNPWFAGFVGFCFSQFPSGILFPYTVGARGVLRQFRNKGWTQLWWRESLPSGKTPSRQQEPEGAWHLVCVQRMDKLLGFGQVSD